ncbi:MAG: HlyD family type I secretion periplasmic adaptor subunit [Magnetococcales bacterium]|nr:HlyD family type I secretion periplasmic adaptor subunit [Magnetococcales bacterium]
MADNDSPHLARTPSRTRRSGRLLYAGFGVLLALLLWASVGRLSVVSYATGVVAPVGRIKAVQHLEGGIVEAILVTEGDVVRKGQPLMRLNPLRATSEHEEITARLHALRADMARLVADVSGTEKPTYPDDLLRQQPELVRNSEKVFLTRKRRFDNELRIQEAVVDQHQEELEEVKVRLDNNKKSMALQGEQVKISSKLLERSLTSQMLHFDLLRQQQLLHGQIEGDQASIPKIKAAIKEAKERLIMLKTRFVESSTEDLEKARQSYDELSKRASKFKDIQERTVLRAPVDGIIKSLAVVTEGGVIQGSQTVMEIVPIGDHLVVDARLPVSEIGYVRAGQKVRLTLASADAPVFGQLSGEVLQVSPDATVTPEGNSYYRIRVRPEGDRFERDGNVYRLYPGVQVACAILVGERSVLAYLLNPVLRSMRFAMQER